MDDFFLPETRHGTSKYPFWKGKSSPNHHFFQGLYVSFREGKGSTTPQDNTKHAHYELTRIFAIFAKYPWLIWGIWREIAAETGISEP